MRVVSGTARGKQLLPVPGMSTRPTTDRVKESVFNIIQMRVRGARVLDLFAGTGQLGIEALSRGAAHADFVDADRAAADVVRKNLAGARVEERASVHQIDFKKYLAGCRQHNADLIFLDPPYGGKLLESALFEIERFDILSPDGIIICESAVEDKWECPFARGREYRYGAIRITVLAAETTPKTP
ncbi:MAG: 16S rRNA (guanine(966)-N(2))-methyltransferase RsmD [Intestinibacillus sp.]